MKKISSISFQNILFLFLLFQILVLIYFNLFRLKYYVDFDMVTPYMQAIESWKIKRLILPDWGYTTSLTLDSSLLPAILLYGITNDIFLSFGISNLIILFVYIFIFNSIFNKLNISNTAKYLALIFVLTPYQISFELGYYHLLFIGTSFYSVKTLIPLLLINIFLACNNKDNIKSYIFWVLLTFILCFISGLSSGALIMVAYIAPILLYEVVRILLSKDIKLFKGRLIIIFCSFLLVSALGVVIKKYLGYSNLNTKIDLISSIDYFKNMGDYFVSFFELFGAFPRYDARISVFDMKSILFVFKYILTGVIFGSFMFCIIYSNKKKIDNPAITISVFLFLTNFFILTLCYTTYGAVNFEYRYHLPYIFPLFILIGITYTILSKKEQYSFLIQGLVMPVLIFLLLTVNLGSFIKYYSLAGETKDYEKGMEISQYSVKEKADMIIFLFDNEKNWSSGKIGRKYKPYLPDIELIRVDINDLHAEGWGENKKYNDNSQHKGTVLLLAYPEIFNRLPVFVKNRYKYVDKLKVTEGINIYRSDNDNIDGSTELPNSGAYIDFPYSPGYISAESSFDNTGNLISKESEAYILKSPEIKSKKGVYNFELDYQVLKTTIDNNYGYFEIVVDNKVRHKAIIKNGSNKVTLSKVSFKDNNQNIRYQIYKPQGVVLKINSIKILKQ